MAGIARDDAAVGLNPTPNGAILAAFLAAGLGAFAMGLFVVLNEAGIFAAPSLHAGAGGVSGRTTFAVAAWLVAWAVLHGTWRARHIEPARVFGLTLLLAVVGILATFPPFWSLL